MKQAPPANTNLRLCARRLHPDQGANGCVSTVAESRLASSSKRVAVARRHVSCPRACQRRLCRRWQRADAAPCASREPACAKSKRQHALAVQRRPKRTMLAAAMRAWGRGQDSARGAGHSHRLQIVAPMNVAASLHSKLCAATHAPPSMRRIQTERALRLFRLVRTMCNR